MNWPFKLPRPIGKVAQLIVTRQKANPIAHLRQVLIGMHDHARMRADALLGLVCQCPRAELAQIAPDPIAVLGSDDLHVRVVGKKKNKRTCARAPLVLCSLSAPKRRRDIVPMSYLYSAQSSPRSSGIDPGTGNRTGQEPEPNEPATKIEPV